LDNRQRFGNQVQYYCINRDFKDHPIYEKCNVLMDVQSYGKSSEKMNYMKISNFFIKMNLKGLKWEEIVKINWKKNILLK